MRKHYHEANVILSEMESWFTSKSADFYEDFLILYRYEKIVENQ